jgi:hypothetical protein
MVRPLFHVDTETRREPVAQAASQESNGKHNGLKANGHKAEQQEPGHEYPVEIAVSNATADDAEKLGELLGLNHKKTGSRFLFASDQRTNVKLLSDEIAAWFGAPGHRSIEICLSK